MRLLADLSQGQPVVYPAHPRRLAASENVTLPAKLHLVDPQPYLAFNNLFENSFAA